MIISSFSFGLNIWGFRHVTSNHGMWFLDLHVRTVPLDPFRYLTPTSTRTASSRNRGSPGQVFQLIFNELRMSKFPLLSYKLYVSSSSSVTLPCHVPSAALFKGSVIVSWSSKCAEKSTYKLDLTLGNIQIGFSCRCTLEVLN